MVQFSDLDVFVWVALCLQAILPIGSEADSRLTRMGIPVETVRKASKKGCHLSSGDIVRRWPLRVSLGSCIGSSACALESLW